VVPLEIGEFYYFHSFGAGRIPPGFLRIVLGGEGKALVKEGSFCPYFFPPKLLGLFPRVLRDYRIN